MTKILVISVHPDDETFGCGGTILKHKNLGDKIHWLIITNIFERNGWEKQIVELRQKEIRGVSELYGFLTTNKLDFPTTQLDTIPIKNLISTISDIFLEVKPNVIYLPNRSDIHTDHQIAFKAVMSCTKNFRYQFIKKILMYETLSETEFSPVLPENNFNPNVFVDITDYFQRKIEIVKVYKSELMKAPYPRSFEIVESIAKYRGSRIGKTYAEAFMLLEEIL